ncbi:MAG: NAD(P)H-dependent oxidoreductase subunit E [Spirochaetes bacterium]|nr:NAD(P)H-dependent oxidoreductase subunit E [Spirochaetota bacterium]
MGKELVKEIIQRYDADSGMLIPMLQDLQVEHGYLPVDQLKRLSKQLDVPLSRIYSVATFYASFRMAPKGQHEVTLCMGTVCYLKGAEKISETICREFKVEPGGTTPDRLFSYQPVNCVGACALAPVMIVDGEYYDGVSPKSAMDILNGLLLDSEDAPPFPEKKPAAKATAAAKTTEKPKPKGTVKKSAATPQAQTKTAVKKPVKAKTSTSKATIHKTAAQKPTKAKASASKTVVQKTPVKKATAQRALKKVQPKGSTGKKEGSS